MNTALGLAKAKIRHKRFTPKVHDFCYSIGYLWLDIDEIDKAFKQSALWSLNKWNIISLHQKDYLPSTIGEPELDMRAAVLELIKRQHNIKLSSATIKLLTIPRFIGYSFNPVSFYFVFSQSVDFPDFIIADITNTPWGERHAYCLRSHKQHNSDNASDNSQQFDFDKIFHVSPFMPMDMQYEWRFSFSEQSNRIHMKLLEHNKMKFFANMEYQVKPMSTVAMWLYPFQFPMQSLKVVFGIYWQALRIKLKGIPYFKHPKADKPQNKT